jgi:hypothetical protein
MKSFGLLAVAATLFSISNDVAADSVEWTVFQTLQLEEAAIDVALSPDERLVFVLTEQGKIIIYSSPTTVMAKIDVGKQVDQIRVSPKGDTLILNSRKDKTVQFIALDFIQNINVSGSPFKGPENAPVMIVAFNDFQ